MLQPRLEIPACDSAAALALERDLGVSFATAQVLVRRGLSDVDAARSWLAADEEHEPCRFEGIDEATALLVRHARAGTRITVHGDYDVDGVCSTAILVRTLRAIGASVDWYLPSRSEDGYGLNVRTVERLAARGTKLLVTADCGITAVDEVALGRSLGLDVVVTDHHSPRADGRLPDAPIVHPAVRGYPCADLCAGGVAYKLARATLEAAGYEARIADADLDLVALATVADCVALRGENRRLVRSGLQALARTEKLGLRALLRVAKCDASKVDAKAVGFRLAPRINAAGRLHRADAALELLLTHDERRAAEIAEELDRANADRRETEQRMVWEAEAQVAELGDRPAYVLWGEGWHAGVVGIVASRIAERHHRPAVLIALDGEEGTGSGRSIPAFDLLGGLDACASRLLRHGGHRAAAGCTIARPELEAFRAEFEAHAASVLSAEDLVPVERVDAVVAGDELGLDLAEELGRLAPFGMGNPGVSLLVPAARLVDPRPMGEGKHLRFTVEAGGVRARAVAFGVTELPEGAAAGTVHATFALELDDWNGAVEPRLVLRKALPCDAEGPTLVGEPAPGTDEWLERVLATAQDPATITPAPGPVVRAVRDRRGGGVAGTIAALVHTGEPVLVVCADAPARVRHLTGRLGGFAVTSYAALARDPSVAASFRHLVALDPPATEGERAVLLGLPAPPEPPGLIHLAWGDQELRYALDVLERDLALRPGLVGAYRALRDGSDLPTALGPRPAAAAGQLLRVLVELELVVLDGGAVRVPPPAGRQELERSPTFRRAAARYAEAQAWLTRSAPARAA